MTAPVIGFAGLTHLGLNMAAAAAARGFRVAGFHADADYVAAIDAGDLPVSEAGLDDLVAANRERLTFSADPGVLAGCDMVYISVDVPTDGQGRSDLTPIRGIIDQIDPALLPDALMVVLCQVPPGFTRALNRDPRYLYYQVETLIFGRAVDRALNPERFIVGCDDPARPLDPRLGDHLAAYGCPVLPMRYESAELAKIAINMCLVASIGAANMMAEICEQVGGDWSEIVPALRLDKRIGEFSYIQPGLGLAGGNLERDIATVIDLANRHGTDAGIARSWVANSERRRDWCLDVLKHEVLASIPGAAVAILGLAYKEGTHSIKNSPALGLLQQIKAGKVVVHDPLVSARHSGLDFRQAATPLDAVKGADAVALMTAWPDYRSIDPADLAVRMRGRTVIDPFKLLSPGAVAAAGLDHFTLGAPPTRAPNTAEASHA